MPAGADLSWGFYFAAVGDTKALHEYLVNPNTPHKLKSGTTDSPHAPYVNVQLDSAKDCMPHATYSGPGYNGEQDPNMLFVKRQGSDAIFWEHAIDKWVAVRGDACIHLAIRHGHVDAVRMLIKLGDANTLTCKNARGNTPDDVAESVGMDWPPTPAPLDVRIGREPRLIRERSCRGCSLFGSLFGTKQYWCYEVQCSVNGAEPTSSWRRYSEFRSLCDWALCLFKGKDQREFLELPNSARAIFFDPQCQEDLFSRIDTLDCFVQRLALHKEIADSTKFLQFCGVEAGTGTGFRSSISVPVGEDASNPPALAADSNDETGVAAPLSKFSAEDEDAQLGAAGETYSSD